MNTPPPDVRLSRLCGWALRYALRRRPALVAVLAALLVQVALQVIKPWPTVFLLDYVLGSEARPASKEPRGIFAKFAGTSAAQSLAA